MVRLAPEHPAAHGYLGEALQRTGDRAGAKEAFQRALELAPDYSFAGECLFDEQLADGELEAAGETLNLLKTHNGDSPFVLAREVQYAAKVDDPESARQALLQLCGSPTEATWPFEAAAAAMDEAEWGAELDEILEEAMEAPRVNPQVYLLWAERWLNSQDWDALKEMGDTEPEGLEERLEALDRAIELNPRLGRAYDVKAEILANVQRYEEAIAACHAEVWEGNVPMFLRGRAAWVEAQRGNQDEAIEQMEAVVAEDPDYYWGWRNLADWYDARRDDENYLRAAEQMVRLTPDNPVAHAYLGEARLRTADRAGAKEAFKRAVAIAPDYPFAGLALVDAQMADGEFDEAAESLAALKENVGGDVPLQREIMLAVKRGDRETAVRALGELCCQESAGAHLFESAIREMVEAGWEADVDRVLEAAMEAPEVNPEVGGLWIKRCVAREDWSCERKLEELLAEGDIGHQALLAYAEALGKKNKKQELARVVAQHRELLRANTHSWAKIGSAFAEAKDFRTAVEWMNDYEDRPDVEPWMLINHALHLRVLGQVAEAFRVNKYALTIAEKDYTSTFHALWMAFDDAVAGKTKSAENRLEQIDVDTLDTYHEFVYRMVEAMLALQQADHRERKRVFREVRSRIEEWVKEHPESDQGDGMVESYRRFVRRLAKDAGTLGAKVWAWQRTIKPRIPKIVEQDV
jgi:tetratricopeptide (TPR) repeat protein